MQFELFRACALGSRVVGANMRRKFVVALQLKVAHHFIERRAGGTTGGFEPPVTFGATKTPKTLSLNPYKLPSHGRLCRCAPMWSDACSGSRLPSREETFSFRSPSRGVAEDLSREVRSLHASN